MRHTSSQLECRTVPGHATMRPSPAYCCNMSLVNKHPLHAAAPMTCSSCMRRYKTSSFVI
jgi:hypothetical protein